MLVTNKQKKVLYISIFLNLAFLAFFFFLVHSLGGINFLKYRINNRGLGAEYEHRKTLYEIMPIEKGDIVFLGNSITAQCDWAELFQNSKIKNRGIPGDTTQGILDRVGAILSAVPSKLFLMIGVNDLLFHPPEEVVDNYRKIVSKVLSESPETQLYLYSILPVNPDIRNIPVRNEDIDFINEKIKKIAIDNQLIYIDLNSKFKNKDGLLFANYSSDGVHLNGDAYLQWKNEIGQYLAN